MSALPPHIATEDEPIPARGDRPWDGPDVRKAMPIPDMLSALGAAAFAGLPSYIRLWRYFAHTVGGSVGLMRTRDGEESLLIGSCVDAQLRHRSRWLHFLTEDLFAREGARDALEADIRRSPYLVDERPRDPRTVTAALRGLLDVGGRVLLTPDGEIEEGFSAEVGRRWRADADERDWQEFLAAGRAYFQARATLNSDEHIVRAVRMLGTRHSNGWHSLRRPADRSLTLENPE